MRFLIIIIIIILISSVHSQSIFFDYDCGNYSGESFSWDSLEKECLGVLKIKRNQIFAHYGRTFKDSQLQKYFESKEWYKVNPNYSDELLTYVDKKNVELIQEIEFYIRDEFAEDSVVIKKIKSLKKSGLILSSDLRYIDIIEQDINGDDINEVLVLSIPWAYMSFEGADDPGDYWYFNAFKKNEKTYDKIKIYADSVLLDTLEISGIKATDYGYRLDGTDYIKFTDNTKDGLPEIYLFEFAYASSPGRKIILEFKNDRLIVIFSESLEINNSRDLDNDGIPELMTNVYYELYGILPELYPFEDQIYKYKDGKYQFSKSLTIQYVKNRINYASDNLRNYESLDNYLRLLQEILHLGNLGEKDALTQAEEIVDKYHHLFVGTKTQWGEVPIKEEMLRDIRNKIKR